MNLSLSLSLSLSPLFVGSYVIISLVRNWFPFRLFDCDIENEYCYNHCIIC